MGFGAVAIVGKYPAHWRASNPSYALTTLRGLIAGDNRLSTASASAVSVIDTHV